MLVERNMSASVSIPLAEIFCYAIICSGVFSDRWEFDNMLSDITKTCLSIACSDVRIPLIAFCTWLLGVGSHITTASTIRPDDGNRCCRILVAMRLNICSASVSGMSWHNIYTHGNEETTATLIFDINPCSNASK